MFSLKKVMILSHCILNPYCEMDQPATLDLYRKTIRELLDREVGILQLPCPELCYQSLERKSITSDDPGVNDYRAYCRQLLMPIKKNLGEYKRNGVEIIGMVGIDTSPSCSTKDSSSIMMKELFRMMEEEGIAFPVIDMPQKADADQEAFLKELFSL